MHNCVYGSIMLKFFLVAHLTYENQWVSLRNKIQTFGFFWDTLILSATFFGILPPKFFSTLIFEHLLWSRLKVFGPFRLHPPWPSSTSQAIYGPVWFQLSSCDVFRATCLKVLSTPNAWNHPLSISIFSLFAGFPFELDETRRSG